MPLSKISKTSSVFWLQKATSYATASSSQMAVAFWALEIWGLGAWVSLSASWISTRCAQALILRGVWVGILFPPRYGVVEWGVFCFPQIALAIGVLTSGWGMRVRRFCGFLAAEAVTQGAVTGCRWRCRLVCVGVRVRRSKTGLSDRVSLEVSSGV